MCISTILQYVLSPTFLLNFTGFPDTIVQNLTYLSHWKSVLRRLNICKPLESCQIFLKFFKVLLFCITLQLIKWNDNFIKQLTHISRPTLSNLTASNIYSIANKG